jgi:hypothetical protein
MNQKNWPPEASRARRPVDAARTWPGRATQPIVAVGGRHKKGGEAHHKRPSEGPNCDLYYGRVTPNEGELELPRIRSIKQVDQRRRALAVSAKGC